MTTCEFIDSILQERGMSRRKLAIKAGIAPSSLQSAMTRNTGLSLDMLFPISDVLKVDVRKLSSPDVNTWYDDLPNDCEREPPDDVADFRPPYGGHEEEIILQLMSKLNDWGKNRLIERAEELLEVPRYREEL